MSSVLLPGGRDVRGTLEEPEGTTAKGLVVCCPPHPQYGGDRSDPRLTAVSEGVLDSEIASLRFDYGPWDEGHGELADVRNAIRWAEERYDRVGLFGYSFGASLSLLAAGSEPTSELVDAVVVLAPEASLGVELDARAAVETIPCSTTVVYGERDSTVDWEPVVEAVSARGGRTIGVPADHFFVGRNQRIADLCRVAFERTLPVNR